MHTKYHLISAIYNEPWVLSVTYNLDYINALVVGVTTPHIAAESDSDVYQPQISGRAVVIPIIGVLTKYDGFCGAPGMITYGERIKQAINDASVDAIVLSIDSPGGQVSGLQTLATIISTSTKPIVAYVDDLACSGAMWVAAKCRSIVASSSTATVGSIGVMATYVDYQKANEMAGRIEHTIYAPQSTDKNQKVHKAFDGDYTAVTADLKVIADCFINEIKSCRPNVLEYQLTGETFFAGDVVGTLVDQIGTLNDAVTLALSHKSNNKKMAIPKTALLAAVVGVETFEVATEGVTLNAEQLDALDTHLKAASAHQTQNETLTNNLATANATIATLTSERDALTARVAALEKKTPGSNPSVVTPVVDSSVSDRVRSQADIEAEAKQYLN